MPIGSIISAVAPSVIGGILGKSGASTQSAGAAQAAGISAATNATNQTELAPYIAAGAGGIQGIQSVANAGPFTMAQAQNSDAENAAMTGASNMIQTSAAAGGGLLSSNTNSALQTSGANIAAQYQNQAFNQWLAQNSQSLSANQSLANIGGSGVQQSIASNNLTSGVQQDAALSQAGYQAGGNQALGMGIVNGVVNGVNNDQTMTALNNLFGNNTQNSVPMSASPYANYPSSTSYSPDSTPVPLQ